MRTKKVVRDYISFSAPALHDFGSNVLSDMTVNPYFPMPDVPLTDLQSALDDLHLKIVAAIGGGMLRTAELHDARRKVEGILNTNGLYVDRIAKGDIAILLSSGYHASKDPVQSPRPEFMADMGDACGTVVVKCKPLKKAGAYIWMMNTDADPSDEANWKNVGYSTQSRGVITDLDSGTRIWFRYCAITPYGLTPCCAPVQVMVP